MAQRWLVEQILNFDLFTCCGNEDLHPFKCSQCGLIMVLCYECDTLYQNLDDLSQQEGNINHFESSQPIFSCPKCGYEFEYYFMKNPLYRVTFEEWINAGFAHLLCVGDE
ncbi:MAG TPA: hypothetical protein V6D29_08685 [Leptolyngbyaceae cyanobacterium]